ncbi:alanine--tRNA ligase, partial [Candidatus Roizmanbacteria bacterium]|nr:alanine--tRNA ligase [Candidatus Roizmanbacteria bacterium]
LDHKEVPAAPLVPMSGDATTLFTSSGMQPLVPYLLGERHPLGTKLFDIQPCLRTQDIEDVGDNRHSTFFEMAGNWSLGEYFKKEQLGWFFTFLTNKENGLGLDPRRLYVTVFEGNDQVPADEESIQVWKELFKKQGVEAEVGKRIVKYSVEKNWWSRSGTPDKMPAGEPGGPDSEVFYQFDVEHDPRYGKHCHPNCDCGRFMEIGNSVFMQFKKAGDNRFEELPQKNVDFGGGLERLITAVNNNPDVFTSDLYSEIIRTIEDNLNIRYSDDSQKPRIRVIADHIKAAVFLMVNGIRPSNKMQGYILRRLLRRAAVKAFQVKGVLPSVEVFTAIARSVLETYEDIYFNVDKDFQIIAPIIEEEISRFGKSLDAGIKELHKLAEVNGKAAFDLYQSHGFPLEITEELAREHGHTIDRSDFIKEFEHHKDLSRSSSASSFKGGLGDISGQTVKFHTATHLLHQALFDILGSEVRQEGSNITSERLRFDFYSSHKPTPEELEQVEKIVNEKITQALPMQFVMLPKDEAIKSGAKSFFREKYPDTVKVYFVGNNLADAYSKEFCGGPHVENTKEIGHFHIKKMEKIGSNLYRIYGIN